MHSKLHRFHLSPSADASWIFFMRQGGFLPVIPLPPEFAIKRQKPALIFLWLKFKRKARLTLLPPRCSHSSIAVWLWVGLSSDSSLQCTVSSDTFFWALSLTSCTSCVIIQSTTRLLHFSNHIKAALFKNQLLIINWFWAMRVNWVSLSSVANIG